MGVFRQKLWSRSTANFDFCPQSSDSSCLRRPRTRPILSVVCFEPKADVIKSAAPSGQAYQDLHVGSRSAQVICQPSLAGCRLTARRHRRSSGSKRHAVAALQIQYFSRLVWRCNAASKFLNNAAYLCNLLRIGHCEFTAFNEKAVL